MTLTLSFPPELEARLRERAAALGRDVESLVRDAVAEKFAEEVRDARGRTREEWAAEFHAWVASHKPVSHFVDDSRESIYADRDDEHSD